MRAAASSSTNKKTDSLPDDVCAQSSYCSACAGHRKQALAAEIADVIKRETVARPHASQTSAQRVLTALNFERDLPRPIRPDTLAWLRKAKRNRRRARARRALSWVLVLAIGVSALTISRTPEPLNGLQSLRIEVARVLDLVSL